CEALASLLALRDTGMLDAEESAHVERHLAWCDACRSDAALDDALASRVRDALVSPASAEPVLSVRQIADAVAERDAADSAVRGDVEERAAVESRSASLRSRAVGRFGGLSALAAVLAVVVLAAYIFGSHSGGSSRLGPIPPTATLSPMLAQETVYLPTDDGIYALRASDGVVRWAFPADITKTPIQTFQAIFGLSLDHGTLYALTSAPENGSLGDHEPRLYALNATNGSVRWSVRVPNVSTTTPFALSLLQVGHLLVVASTTQDVSVPVFAFSTANGKLVWRRTLDEPTLSKPVAAGGSVYIGTTGHVVALNVADGTVRWTSSIEQKGTHLAATNSSVALAAGGERVYALGKHQFTPDGNTHNVMWVTTLYALAASDGSRLWGESFEDMWDTAFAPALAGDTAYVAFGGGITAIALTGITPEERWRFIPDGSTMQNPAMTGAVVSGGIVYTTDLTGVMAHHDGLTSLENCTYAVRASDGVELWRTPSDGGTMAASPVVADGLILAPAGDVLRVF
ncbi:MAG: outer membrane protein assembly factor BamB family protein, partial [Ktedonobacterales bacterium]